MPRLDPRVVLAGGAMALAALALPAAAEPLPDGATQILAGPQATAVGFATPQVVMTQGSTATLSNVDLTAHDVVSRLTRTVVVKKKKKSVPVFASAIITSGQMSVVSGTASLKPGEYDFYCSLHGSMQGTLVVR